MSFFRKTAAVAALAGLAACAPAPKPPLTPAQQTAAREERAIDALHLRSKYKDIVLGWGVRGSTLDVFADQNNLESMDEPVEDAMIADILTRWKTIWAADHPKTHAKLRVSVRDYYGSELASKSATV